MTNWVLRPILWFATASMTITVFHELTHATVAYAFGVRSTLHNYAVHLELTPDQAATSIPAIIGIAGPSLCLVVGMVAWVAFKRACGSAAELPLLFVAIFGVATFFGNLVSATLIGDFSRAAVALSLPMPARYVLSLVGVVGTAAVHYLAGRELARWVPPTAGRVGGMLGITAVPVVAGMGIVILVNMPAANAAVRIAEASFWVFAAIGAFVSGAANQPPPRLRRSAEASAKAEATPYVPYVGRPFRGADHLRWADAGALLLAILIVRVLVRGIPFLP